VKAATAPKEFSNVFVPGAGEIEQDIYCGDVATVAGFNLSNRAPAFLGRGLPAILADVVALMLPLSALADKVRLMAIGNHF
jgi:hypothetical protein